MAFFIFVVSTTQFKLRGVFQKHLQSQSEYPKALNFFEGLLRDQGQCRLEEEYPLVFNSNLFSSLYIVEDGEDLLAGLGTLERQVEIDKDQYARALFIGSVVTHPKSRRQGHQRLLFNLIEETAEQKEIDFLVLWSNQVEFYEKLGFQLGGLQASWFIDHKSAFGSDPAKAKVDSTRNIPWRSDFFRSFAMKHMVVSRSEEEMKKLWMIPKMTAAYTQNAYALIGKGEDFQGVCHEWAGPGDEVIECLKAFAQHSSIGSYRVLSPGIVHNPDEMKVIAALDEASSEQRLEYLGLIKTLSSRLNQEGFNPESMKYPFFIWGLDSI